MISYHLLQQEKQEEKLPQKMFMVTAIALLIIIETDLERRIYYLWYSVNFVENK